MKFVKQRLLRGLKERVICDVMGRIDIDFDAAGGKGIPVNKQFGRSRAPCGLDNDINRDWGMNATTFGVTPSQRLGDRSDMSIQLAARIAKVNFPVRHTCILPKARINPISAALTAIAGAIDGLHV